MMETQKQNEEVILLLQEIVNFTKSKWWIFFKGAFVVIFLMYLCMTLDYFLAY